MSTEELRNLKQALLDEYSHFADRRLKNIDKGDRFIIDDREGNRSYGSDGTPYGWFCEMYADVENPTSINVAIVGPLPTNDAVEKWMTKNDVKLVKGQYGARDRHIFTVTPANVDMLASFAKALKSLGLDKNRRSKSDYYVCPRIASCLLRLQEVLKAYWLR